MHEVGAHQILARQMLFAQCFNSNKELTINHSTLQETAEESRMMVKRVYSCSSAGEYQNCLTS